jgi:hypothetical protein
VFPGYATLRPDGLETRRRTAKVPIAQEMGIGRPAGSDPPAAADGSTCTLCRYRHNAHYPETAVMPIPVVPVLAGGGERALNIGITDCLAA